jgi:hypothetical protein
MINMKLLLFKNLMKEYFDLYRKLIKKISTIRRIFLNMHKRSALRIMFRSMMIFSRFLLIRISSHPIIGTNKIFKGI